MDQYGKVANPPRSQLNRENDYFPVPVHALEFGLARRVRASRPASVCSFSTLRLNLVLTHGIPPDFRGGVHLFSYTDIRHRVYQVAQMHTDGVHCLESIGTGPVVLKAVPVTDAAFAGLTMDQLCAPLVSHPHYWSYSTDERWE